MSASEIKVNVDLIKSCLSAFNEIVNKKLSNGISTYDLASKLTTVLQISSQLRGRNPNDFLLVNWDLVYSIDAQGSCDGEVVCLFTDSYSSIEEAAVSGAIYFGSQPICNRYELEGALIGHEVTVKSTGVNAEMYFLPRLID